jgi:RNA 3'-terminal phosphate cyclase
VIEAIKFKCATNVILLWFTMEHTSLLHYSGHLFLRQRLVLSILSGKALKVDKIRPDDKNPGLRGTRIFFPLRAVV